MMSCRNILFLKNGPETELSFERKRQKSLAGIWQTQGKLSDNFPVFKIHGLYR
jgi:hypothetical protein